MSAGRAVVVKVGGSLLDWPELPARLTALIRTLTRPVLIAGGGRAADFVRELDRVHRLGEARAHALALRSLDLTAWSLAASVPGLFVAEDRSGLADAWSRGLTPVLVPRPLLGEDDRAPDPLPHTWAVTSDSIAARLARLLDAAELLLLKSAPLPPGADRLSAAHDGVVDPHFPEASRGMERVMYWNLRDPSAGPRFLP